MHSQYQSLILTRYILRHPKQERRDVNDDRTGIKLRYTCDEQSIQIRPHNHFSMDRVLNPTNLAWFWSHINGEKFAIDIHFQILKLSAVPQPNLVQILPFQYNLLRERIKNYILAHEVYHKYSHDLPPCLPNSKSLESKVYGHMSDTHVYHRQGVGCRAPEAP